MRFKCLKSIILYCVIDLSTSNTVVAQKTINEELFYSSAYHYINTNWNYINKVATWDKVYPLDSIEFITGKRVFTYPYSRIFENQKLIKSGYINESVKRNSVQYYNNLKLLSDTFACRPIIRREEIYRSDKKIILIGFYGVFKYDNDYFVVVAIEDLFRYRIKYLLIKMDKFQIVLDVAITE